MDELQRVQALVDGLARRERRLLVGELTARAALVGAVTLVGAAAASWWSLAPPLAAAGLVVGSGVALWLAVGWPWLARWGPAASPRRQARLLEDRDPELRGRLMTVVDRVDGPLGAESPVLLARLARKALVAAARHAPEAVHPGEAVRAQGVGAGVAWLVAVGLLLAGPGGLPGVWGFWRGHDDALHAGRSDDAAEVVASARVGDLTLRYVYPAYTQLEPYEVVNSTGEVHGPPGTQVEVVARSAEAVESASLVAYDEPALDAEVREERSIAASFVIQPRAGTYRLELRAGGEVRSTQAFPIVVEPDLAPEVTLGTQDGPLEIAVDEPLLLRWAANDDYGLDRVELEVDGQPTGAALSRPRSRLTHAEDVVQRRPLDLGLAPGRTYELVVAAWDNDTVSGSKVGRSSTVRVTVLDEDGAARLTDDKRLELLDLLVALLATHLEDTYPPGRMAGDFARWGETLASRYQPLASFVDQFRGRRGLAPEWAEVEGALEDGSTLIRFTQVSFVPGVVKAAHAGSVAAVDTLRLRAIESTEAAVLQVDGLIGNRAVREISEAAEELAVRAHDLRRFAEAADLGWLSLELAELASDARRLDELASRLKDGGLSDLVEARSAEAQALIEEAGRAVAERDVAEARTLSERVAFRLEELADGIREDMERRRERSDSMKGKQRDLIAQLEDLERRQQELAAEVAAARQEADQGYREQVRSLWERVQAQARTVGTTLQAYRDAMPEPRAHGDGVFNAREIVADTQDRADAAVTAAEALDLSALRGHVIDTEQAWRQYEERMLLLGSRFERLGLPAGAPLTRVTTAIRELQDLVEQLRRKDAAGDPAVRAQVRQAVDRQEQLSQEMSSAAGDARRLAQEMTVTPRELEPALKGATERMEGAVRELRRGDGMQAQGSQEAAAQHVRQIIESIKQAGRSAAQQQEEMEGGGSGEEGGDAQSGPGEGDEQQPQPMQLPEPEEFRTPEEYRAMLLRGMEGDVPEEYRALKRRYYEELVHQ
ncbi:MAG: hypothetical protein H6732_13940 [Alphaproteobacteria bacterium]|nr:hypothetical protein [Alphaproteobacteria bacterium]